MAIRTRGVRTWLMVFSAAAAGAAAALYGYWLPAAQRLMGIGAATAQASDGNVEHEHDAPDADHDHDPAVQAEADHDHAETADADHAPQTAGHQHDESAALRVSKEAEASLGRDLFEVRLRPFARTVSTPATVVRRPGQSKVEVSAPFTGLVTRLYRTEGEAVTPGTPLFDLQLTHEELVDAQADFLRLAEELDVVQREIERLAKVAADGVVAGKTLLQAQYEQQKLEAALRAQRQRLLLHRLSGEQVEAILKDHTLLQQLTVTVPQPAKDSRTDGTRLMQVDGLKVERGRHVAAGDPLCVLTDDAELQIEGKAFEQDIPKLAAAAKNRWPVTAVFPLADQGRYEVPNLEIFSLGRQIDEQSRAFSFYVLLPNELVRDTTNPTGQRLIDWKFKPGQRLRLLVPLEPATERVVLPVEAVVREGAESYVFQSYGDHFDRRSVHVEYRDQDRVVIAKDSGLELGARVAVSGAYQIHLATKNKQGTGMDPHAGHNH